MSDLLPATHALLLEVMEGLDADNDSLPELRVGNMGRSGSRYWLHGVQRKPFPGRRPIAQFQELCAAGFLLKLRTESSGTYYSFTSLAFEYRDQLRRPTKAPTLERLRPDAPPPELIEAESRLVTLRTLAAAAEEALIALAETSSITEFRNDPGSGLYFVPLHPWTWDPLDSSAVTLLGDARTATERWIESATPVIALTAPEHLEEFSEHNETCRRVLDRSKGAKGPPASTVAGVNAAVRSALADQLALIAGLPGAAEPSETLIVPDTNALLEDPDIEDWVLGDAPSVIVVVQQVVSELDERKVRGNEGVATKATGLIRRFNEYGRRGDTLEGVKLAGSTLFREVALTSDMSQLPGSLDPSHADDRILAAALHLASVHLSSRVALVTRDRNLRNKARFVRLPAVDVADL